MSRFATVCSMNIPWILRDGIFKGQHSPSLYSFRNRWGKILPFGVAVRGDGTIYTSSRADWWLERDITKKETDCCPKTLSDNSLCDTDDTVCAE